MAWPRFCASSSSAKVESPRMLIRSIGSICTAMFRRIDAPRTCFPTASCHPTALAAGVERRGDMTRNTAGRHQHGIETDIADAIIGVLREPRLGGGGDAQALAIGDRPCGVVQPVAGLDLDEHQQAAAAGDDVDFADRAPPAARQDAKAFGDEKTPPPGSRLKSRCETRSAAPGAELGSGLRAAAHRSWSRSLASASAR